MKYVKIHEYSDIMKKIDMRCPGIEPGSTAWKAAMLTTIPTSLTDEERTYCKSLIYLVLDTLNIDWILTFYQINSFFVQIHSLFIISHNFCGLDKVKAK